MNSLVLIYVGYSHTSGVTGGYTIVSVKKSKTQFHVYNQKYILYDLSFPYCIGRRRWSACLLVHTHEVCSSRAYKLVENYRQHVWKSCTEPKSSTLPGLSHLSSFIIKHERECTIHFSDEETQDHC